MKLVSSSSELKGKGVDLTENSKEALAFCMNELAALIELNIVNVFANVNGE